MGDHLFLSFWLAGFSPLAMSVYARKLLARFPHSKLEPRSTLRVYALSFQEAPQLEEFNRRRARPQGRGRSRPALPAGRLRRAARNPLGSVAVGGRMAVAPLARLARGVRARVRQPRAASTSASTAAPESLFLPHPSSDQLRPVQSNLRSLLHLAHDLENDLMVERRLLWSEEDDNFAARVETMLA